MVCEDHLLYRWQHLWAIWSKSCYLIGYPGKQEFWSFSRKILHGVDFHRVAKFHMEVQEAADDNQRWKNTDFMVLLCNWHFFFLALEINKSFLILTKQNLSHSFFVCLWTLTSSIWSKSCYLIGYPGKQEFWSFSRKILHGVDFHRVAKFHMEVQEAADDNQRWKNTDFMVLLCNWHFFFLALEINKSFLILTKQNLSHSFFVCLWTLTSS